MPPARLSTPPNTTAEAAIAAMAHSQVSLVPQARTSLPHNETTAMAATKQVPKRRDGAREPAAGVYLA